MSEQGKALAAPFPPDVLGWKAQTVMNNRALAVAYIDARDVMDRLDAVVGAENWRDEYTPLPDGNVVCRLSLRLDSGEWIGKEDVGGESDQPDEGDKRKAAFSDALKRAAVKWGVGRYLYRLPASWVDYDPQRKAIISPPQLPKWALPEGAPAVRKPAPAPARKEPATPAELQERLCKADEDGAAAGHWKPGELVAYVIAAGNVLSYSDDLASWPVEGIPRAVAAATKFMAAKKHEAA